MDDAVEEDAAAPERVDDLATVTPLALASSSSKPEPSSSLSKKTLSPAEISRSMSKMSALRATLLRKLVSCNDSMSFSWTINVESVVKPAMEDEYGVEASNDVDEEDVVEFLLLLTFEADVVVAVIFDEFALLLITLFLFVGFC